MLYSIRQTHFNELSNSADSSFELYITFLDDYLCCSQAYVSRIFRGQGIGNFHFVKYRFCFLKESIMSAFGHTHLEFIFHCGTKESVLTGQKYYLDSLSESKQCARKKKMEQ